MNTPICDFVKKYAEEKKSRMHMPGHKGKEFLGCEALDITEVNGADVLYSGDGIIKKSEENASLFFGTQKTLYSTEGSSLCIRAMLFLISLYGESHGRKRKIAAGRNAHKTFVTGAALMDFQVDWLSGDTDGAVTRCNITSDTLDEYFSKVTELPAAVYITTPDYTGNIADIKAISRVCRQHGVLLAVDNAHGSYLKFLPHSLHPMDMGADICCDSAHKTLPVLTGGAYLHISENAPSFLGENAENAMSLFASTSPSYLILQSLDNANLYISQGYPEKLNALCRRMEKIKACLKEKGYSLFGNEPLKLTVAPKSYGYTGCELSEIMAENNIICEFSDPDYTVFMITCENDAAELDRLEKALLSLPKRNAITGKPPAFIPLKTATTLNKALFSESEEIAVTESAGRIAATPTVSCPPAIPVAVCGEIIDEAAVQRMRYYGIERIKVLKGEAGILN